MKKIILTAAFILFVGVMYGQSLQKGNLIGTHLLTLELKQGVTMEQFQEFYIKKFIPEFEKIRNGWKVYLVKGIRGEHANSYGLIIVIESEELRDKHYNDDGNLSEFGKAALEKLAPVREELDKLVTFSATYTDWVIL